jgi:uncharacterized protein (TIGR02246 family)
MGGRVLLLAATLGAMTACAEPAPEAADTSADEARISGDAGVWFAHYNAGHADSVASLYAEDGILMPPGSPASTGRAAIQEFIAGDIAQSKAGGVSLHNGEVTGVGVSGDLAWLSATFTVADSTGATVDTGKYLSLYRRSGDGWLLIRDTWNSDAPAAAASPAPAAPAM